MERNKIDPAGLFSDPISPNSGNNFSIEEILAGPDQESSRQFGGESFVKIRESGINDLDSIKQIIIPPNQKDENSELDNKLIDLLDQQNKTLEELTNSIKSSDKKDILTTINYVGGDISELKIDDSQSLIDRSSVTNVSNIAKSIESIIKTNSTNKTDISNSSITNNESNEANLSNNSLESISSILSLVNSNDISQYPGEIRTDGMNTVELNQIRNISSNIAGNSDYSIDNKEYNQNNIFSNPNSLNTASSINNNNFQSNKTEMSNNSVFEGSPVKNTIQEVNKISNLESFINSGSDYSYSSLYDQINDTRISNNNGQSILTISQEPIKASNNQIQTIKSLSPQKVVNRLDTENNSNNPNTEIEQPISRGEINNFIEVDNMKGKAEKKIETEDNSIENLENIQYLLKEILSTLKGPLMTIDSNFDYD